jgi:DNA-binding beta-propeller fold protein YncE
MRFRALALLLLCAAAFAQEQKTIPLPTGHLLASVPGTPRVTNSFPGTMAVSPDRKYIAVLNNGWGTTASGYQQSIAILNVATNELKDFPDSRLGPNARQTYFYGLAWSADGKHLYASISSITDPEGARPGSTGNGIAVYSFSDAQLAPERFIRISLQTAEANKRATKINEKLPGGKLIPYPAGLAVVPKTNPEQILVADNMSDDALLINSASGEIIRRFDLSTAADIPAAYPMCVAVNKGGEKAWVSLWNASAVAELDLENGKVTRHIALRKPKDATASGSHPAALLLTPDEKFLYAALATTDEVAVISLDDAKIERYVDVAVPGQSSKGAYPVALAQSEDGSRLAVADAGANAVAVFPVNPARSANPSAWIPTQWYPAALSIVGDDVFVASAKGVGTGPNNAVLSKGDKGKQSRTEHPYIMSLLPGSVARVSITDAEKNLTALTQQVIAANRLNEHPDRIEFAREAIRQPWYAFLLGRKKNPIKHVIYIIKENRTYDQVFGDLGVGDGDSSLTMYGEDVTPNQHKLARQFGVLDNFYDSGEVSGSGHTWSTAAISSDYTERTMPIGYRGRERTYDYEGGVANGIPLNQGIPDLNEPGTGYLWTNVARHKLSYRHYGEYVNTHWCDDKPEEQSPLQGTPLPQSAKCSNSFVRKGEPLADGRASPWPWPVPIIAFNEPTKPELRDHFDPKAADYRIDYPDQLRADEFLREFGTHVQARQRGKDALPRFIVLRLPNDHTAGTRPGMPRPAASVADNDLAVGRVVEAVSHSAYWDDTAIFILEDDAQDGVDHVDAHRSTALVISKYSPSQPEQPFVDHTFYTTVSMIHAMEVLLNLPPMNVNDAHAPVMEPLFSGKGTQAVFTADYRNRDNGLIYQVNEKNAPGARESMAMDFSHADKIDAAVLNKILWRDRMGDRPMPAPVHNVCGQQGSAEDPD